MPKNMIRKSLALGATSALVVTGFAALPANAAGLADKSFVSLAPTSGAEYDVLTGASKTFSLTANEASSVAGTGRNLKFLVTDADSKIEPTAATIGRSFDLADAATLVATTAELVSITDSTLAAALSEGDRLHFTEALTVPDDTIGTDSGSEVDVVAAAGSIVTISDITSNVVQFTTPTTIGTAVSSAAAITDDVTVEVVREARASDGSYVVDSGIATDATDEVLVLSTGASEDSTRSVTVTAWVDNNGNDEIDATEYTSETRTVTFHKADAVAATATIQTLTVGDTSVVAHVATTPTLNGDQMSDGDVNAEFTVQGSPNKFTPVAASSVWNTTNNVWVSTLTRQVATSNTAVASGVLTVTHTSFGSDLGLTVGEKVKLDVPAGANDGSYTVASVPGATSFTAATTSTTNTGAEVGTVTVEVIPGSYSARAKAGSTYLGAATGSSVVTVTADDGKTSMVETPNISVSVSGNDDTTATVRAGTLALTAVMSFEDSDDVAVTAGRPVVLTVNTDSVEGLTVNGTSVDAADTVAATTDANGQVTVAITATDADNGEEIKITGVAEGISGTSTFIDIDYADASYTLYDVKGAGTARSISAGGSYTFDFLIADQWAQPQTGDVRLQVALTGNTVSTTTTSIATGRTSVTVADGELGSSNVQAVVTPQKLQTDGTTWNGTGTASAITYTLYPVAQTGAALTLTTADDSVPFPTTAVVAGDARLTYATVTGDGTAGTDAIELTGVVTDGTNGTVKSGAPVTISGPSSLLFVDGNRAQFGSITTYADANGAYSVHVRSNTAQEKTVVTATSQGASKTDEITFEAAGETTGAAINIAMDAFQSAGSTVTMVATLTDKFGNVVKTTTDAYTKITYSGPGFTVPATLPVDFDADGTMTVRVILGTNDTGTGTFTVSYDENQDGDFLDATDLVVAKTYTIGSGYGTVSAWTKDMGDGTAKVYVKFPTVGDKVRIGHQTGGSGSYETIFVKTIASESDSALTVNANGSYIVRTIDLEDINRIRVTVGDDTLVQVRYNQ